MSLHLLSILALSLAGCDGGSDVNAGVQDGGADLYMDAAGNENTDSDTPVAAKGTCDSPLDLSLLAAREGTVDTYKTDIARSEGNAHNAGCAGTTPGDDLVFHYVPDTSGLLIASAISSTGFRPALYMRTTCSDDTSELACHVARPHEFLAVIATQVTASDAYWLVVDGAEAVDFGQFSLSTRVIEGVVDAEAGDADCMLAKNVTLTGSDVMAGTGAGSISSSDDIFYSFTTSEPRTVSILTDSDFDAELVLLDACGGSILAGSAHDATTVDRETINEELAAGTYIIAIHTTQDNGDYKLLVSAEAR